MDLGILLLRLTVGLILAAHGSQILFGWFGGYGPDATGQFMEALGFHPGRRHALAAGVVELVGGLLLALGFATPLATALIASVMVVAVGAAALSVAFTGPGALSVDGVAGYARGGIPWGLGAAVVAVLGAVGGLAQRAMPPPGGTTPAAHPRDTSPPRCT